VIIGRHMTHTIRLFGILNCTEDSFSDGGQFLEAEAAIRHARALAAGGAHVIDVGAASSRPDAREVATEIEIARLGPVVHALQRLGLATSVDSFSPAVQRWALGQNVQFLNDVRGFPDPSLYPALAASAAQLIVMFSAEGAGAATRIDVPDGQIIERIEAFFDARLAAFKAAGIARERLILDPGMGYFLGTRPETSFRVLHELGRLKARFGLPVLISLSRKLFVRNLAHVSVQDAGPATLAGELFAAMKGADMIRTHEPAPLHQALSVWQALAGYVPPAD